MKSLHMTRREWFVRGTGGAVASLAFGGELLGLAAPGSDDAKTKPGGFRLGVCDWTIGKRCDPAALALAKQLGLDGVQVDLGPPADVLQLQAPELQEKYRDAVKTTGVEVASLAIASLNEAPYESDPRAERWVADSIDVCKALGTRVVLLAFFGKGDFRNDAEGVDAVVQKLKQIAPKAEKSQVILGVESQLSARQHMEILDRVGSPAVQVYYDVGNSHHEGYDIYQEIRFLGQHICEFHAKDYDDLYGKGSINFPEVRRAMDDIGYRGWMQIEGVKFPLGLEESIRYDAHFLRGVFPPKA
jgi:sugar phosphate isomerase/epimerase